MGSIWSYPQRGHWGDARYRGNASGYVYRDLYRRLQPSFVIDPCVGGGTSVEVAQELGIEAVGLDLRSGFNLLRDSILEVVGRPADLVVSHLPYHSMIVYSGGVYPGAHTDDLSRCGSVEEFLEKAHQSLLNQRDAVRPGGYYATLIGDHRQCGRYHSYQSEFIARMPDDELQGVLIKAQHNCRSDDAEYPAWGAGLPRIGHEYLIVWRRPERPTTTLGTLQALACRAQRRLRSTWRAIVRQALVSLGGEASLSELYRHVSGVAGERTTSNPHWQAKVRQVLQRSEGFAHVARGRWAIA